MTEALAHDDAVGLVTGVDPDHGHWLESQVDEVMAEALWHECRGITGKLVAPPFDDAGRCPLHNRDGLVEFMTMAGKSSAGLEYAVAAANPMRAELGAEQVLEECSGGQLESYGRVVAA